MLVVFDTNHFREVAEATARAAHFSRRAEAERAEVFLSIITVQEATSGWLALINSLNAGRNQIRGYASFQKTMSDRPLLNTSWMSDRRSASVASCSQKPMVDRAGILDSQFAGQ